MTANLVKKEGAFDSSARREVNSALGDVSLCTSQLSVASSTTLANVTGLVTDVLPAGIYDFEIRLITTAGASGGVKAALKQSVSGMVSSISASVSGLSAAAVENTTFTTATDAASVIAATSAYVAVNVKGVVVIGSAGTLQVQVAQNASNATATTVEVNSYMRFKRIA